jgi:hypothetical protein
MVAIPTIALALPDWQEKGGLPHLYVVWSHLMIFGSTGLMRSASIKTMLGVLEVAFGVEGSKIYERQRALVEAGLLASRPGRGPGSGVPASPRNISILLLALMAADNPKLGSLRAGEIAGYVPLSDRRKCAITGARNLLDAMEQILVGGDIAAASLEILDDHLAALQIWGGKERRQVIKKQLFFLHTAEEINLSPAITRRTRFDLRHLHEYRKELDGGNESS